MARQARKKPGTPPEPTKPQERSRPIQGQEEFKLVARVFSIQSSIEQHNAQIRALQAELKGLWEQLGIPHGTPFQVDFEANVIRWAERPRVRLVKKTPPPKPKPQPKNTTTASGKK